LYRSDFPIFKKRKELVYFDTAVTAQKPSCVIDAITRFYSEDYASVHRGVYELARGASDQYQNARRAVKEFLNASSEDEIIFTRGTTASLNLVARSFGKAFLKKGDIILVTEIEHHANLIPWQLIAEDREAILRFLPVNDKGEILLEEAAKMISEGVKIISLAHISNVTGVLHPIKKIVEMASKVGAKVCLDGAQSAGHLPIDVRELGVDFFAFSGHKMYGPTGVGVLYGRKELLEKMPPMDGGGDMIEKVTLEHSTFAKAPLKFEAGTPMTASVMGLKSAVDYLMGIGLEKVSQLEQDLTTYAKMRLQEIPGLTVIGDANSRGAILSFVIAGIHPLDLGTLLDCKGIAMRTGHHCSQPAMKRFGVTSTCRISFGIYNLKEEIDFFINSLKGTLRSLK
jgi:cysteine desulfurase/selenocysteine lyase